VNVAVTTENRVREEGRKKGKVQRSPFFLRPASTNFPLAARRKKKKKKKKKKMEKKKKKNSSPNKDKTEEKLKKRKEEEGKGGKKKKGRRRKREMCLCSRCPHYLRAEPGESAAEPAKRVG